MRLRPVALAVGLLAAAVTVPAGADTDVVAWAPAETATIRPGVQVTTASGGCTTNFVFTERRTTPSGVETDVLIGLAAHCFSLDGPTATNACTARSLPLGSPATVRGSRFPATLVYSSWITAQAVREQDPAVCAVNDFALVRLDEADVARVNPSLLAFGGPNGVRRTSTGLGDLVHTYGNSSLRFGLAPTSPKRGTSTGTTNSGWSHRVYTATPGVPGDSGSAVLDADGKALGVLVTLQTAPFPASNGITDLGRALAYANAKTGRSYALALGTEPFDDPVLP